MYCPNCGKETDGKFCQFCGAPLPQAVEAPVTAPPAQARRQPWLPIAAFLGVAVVVVGAFVFRQIKPASASAVSGAEQEPEPTSEATEEPLPESYIEGVSTEAYWKGIEAVNGFDEDYWKAAVVDVGEIFIETAGEVDDPVSECLYKMPSVFENAEFVQTARQSIDAITDETQGPDYEFERLVGASWLLKAEGTITKALNGEETAPIFKLYKLDESELKYGDGLLEGIVLTATGSEENKQTAREIVQKGVTGDTEWLDNLFLALVCSGWLECGQIA